MVTFAFSERMMPTTPPSPSAEPTTTVGALPAVPSSALAQALGSSPGEASTVAPLPEDACGRGPTTTIISAAAVGVESTEMKGVPDLSTVTDSMSMRTREESSLAVRALASASPRMPLASLELVPPRCPWTCPEKVER